MCCMLIKLIHGFVAGVFAKFFILLRMKEKNQLPTHSMRKFPIRKIFPDFISLFVFLNLP